MPIGAGSIVAAALLYLPWIAYGKWADPSHSRLLKWHLAGVTSASDEPFLRTLVRAYENASPEYLRNAREANLRRAFDIDLGARLHPGAEWRGAMRTQDFFSPTFAIGLGTLLTVAFVLVVVLRLVRKRRCETLDVSSQIVGLSLACMILWALVMFLPDGALVHTGTYVWLVVFAAVPFAWMARWSRVLATSVVVAQATYSAVVYHGPDPTLRDPALSVVPVVVLVAGVLGTIATMAVVWARSRADRADTGTAPVGAVRPRG
jgi:hypothetical protein